LEYLVNETLAGRGERLKGYNVALEVFDRPESFDPVTDPLVRIEAARLREKLREYYGTDGQDDLIHIDLPKGTYTPHIEFRHEGAPLGRRNVLQEQDVSSTVPSVAVLPFDDLSAHQNLGIWVTGWLKTSLQRSHAFRIWQLSPAVPPGETCQLAYELCARSGKRL